MIHSVQDETCTTDPLRIVESTKYGHDIPFPHGVFNGVIDKGARQDMRRNIGVKPGSSETLNRLEGGCYVPTLGTYDTSATTAWYKPNPKES